MKLTRTARTGGLAILSLVILLAVPTTLLSCAEEKSETSSNHSADEKALRSQAKDYAAAYAKGNAKVLAGMWTEDGTYTDLTGQKFVGRSAIEKFLADGFGRFGGEPFDITVDSIRFLSDSVAVEEGRTRFLKGQYAGSISRYTAVHVKDGDKWRMATVSEINETVPSNQGLTELAWMVGDWKGKTKQGDVHLKADWAGGNRKFIHCLLSAEGQKGQSVQIIGWDPLSCGLKSWHFDAVGGYGSGNWHKDGDTWLETTDCVECDGGMGGSVNVIRRLNDNSFSWRSTGRMLDNESLPDTPEIILVKDSFDSKEAK